MWYLVHSPAVNRFFVLDKESLMEKRHILNLELIEVSEDYQYLSNLSQSMIHIPVCLN